MFTAPHQPNPNAKARADVAAIVAQLVPDLDASNPQSIVYALGELPRRYGLADDHIFELVRQAARRVTANEFTLAISDVRRLASACEASVKAARATADRAAAQRAAVANTPVGAIAQALGIEPSIGAIRRRLVDGQLAHQLVGRRLLDALTKQTDGPELRRLAAAAGLVDRESVLMPTADDWMHGIPPLHGQTRLVLPRWCGELATMLGVPPKQDDLARRVEKLIIAHAAANHFLAAFWTRELRGLIACPGPESGERPDEFRCCTAIGAFTAGGAS